MTRHLRPADDGIQGDEHVPAADRAVLEWHIQREVASSDLDPRRVRRDQRSGDTVIVSLANEVLRVIELEREAHHRCNRSKRDIALFPIEANADHFLPVYLLLADDAGIGNGCGV